MANAKSVVENWLDAVEARDVERITDLLADDVMIESEAISTPVTGKQMLRDLLVGTLDAYESIEIDRRKVIASGNDVAVFAHVRARFGKDVDVLGEKLPTAGKSLDIVAAMFAEVNDAGKIARLMRVRDTLGVIQQLGLSAERIAALTQKFESQLKKTRKAA